MEPHTRTRSQTLLKLEEPTMVKQIARGAMYVSVGALVGVLLYPFPSTVCGTKGDLLTHRPMDFCIEKRQPLVMYMLGW